MSMSRGCCSLDTAYVRHRFVARLLVPRVRDRHAAELDRYTAVLSALYAAVRDISDCTVIVDSTKDPPYSVFLHGIAGMNLRRACCATAAVSRTRGQRRMTEPGVRSASNVETNTHEPSERGAIGARVGSRTLSYTG